MIGAGQRDPASNLHPTSSADVTDISEREDDCETPSKVLKKISVFRETRIRNEDNQQLI
jgi:hypothetical protein